MKLVRENIKFERGQDPKQSMGIGLMKAMENMGIRFWFGWGEREEGEREKQKLLKIENLNKMYNFINKLIDVGFNPKGISISSADHITVKVVQVLRSNHVIHECATQEDAEILINASEAFSMEHYPGTFTTSKGEKMVYLNSHEWLDNLIENRKKYKNI